MFKKFIALFLCVTVIFCFSSCGDKSGLLPLTKTNKDVDNTISATAENNIQPQSQTQQQTQKQTQAQSQKPTQRQPQNFTQQPTHTHVFSKATCTEPARCSCGQTNGTALGHNYVKFKCTRCGDEQNLSAIEKLKSYIIENGETYGSLSRIYWYEDKNTNSIGYDANENVVYFSYAETVSGGETIYTEIVLSESLNHKYYCDYANQCDIRGYINARSFTANSPLAYTECTGDFKKREMFLNDTRVIILHLLCEVDARLAEIDIGVRIDDFGFVNL